jgi:16S rRNA pseudouridine516 synthase
VVFSFWPNFFMSARRNRLDRLIGKQLGISRDEVRLMVAQQRVKVDGNTVADRDLLVDGFSVVSVDATIISSQQPVYLMMNKPDGILSATRDPRHPVATSLIGHPAVASLHVAGRLDLHASGLLLLTNDGRWSRQLSSPQGGVSKEYDVTVKNPLAADYIQAFAQGMYFGFEDLTTLPARLEILGECRARVTLQEGRYHQIKRMFGRFRNPVLSIHRTRIGGLVLDAALMPGEWRELSAEEVQAALST